MHAVFVEDQRRVALEGVEAGPRPWQRALFEVIFGTETRAGSTFDMALLVAIVVSVVATLLESVEAIRAVHGEQLIRLELLLTVLFTIELVLRCLCVRSVKRYLFSFFGVVDVVSILPTYLGFFGAGRREVLVLRALRLLRIFRVLHLGTFLREARLLQIALTHARHKIFVFLGSVLVLVVNLGALMYVVEGPAHGFTSIPRSIYWAIVTLTTVGYGDIAPQTPLGQSLAIVVMIVGYSIIAVPTGIVSVELAEATRQARTCPACERRGHQSDASFCRHCGNALRES